MSARQQGPAAESSSLAIQSSRQSLRSVTVSKYRLIATLGKGGMATVYLGIYGGPGGFRKLQVIKRLRPALAEDPEFLQMFLNEARLAARLSHPNVVQTNEIGSEGAYHFIAMEYLEGQSLERVCRAARKQGKTIPLAVHLRILSQVLDGLHYAHNLCDFDGTPLNVVHRDVSPHNVMVTYGGHVKVLDFGIAKAADSSQTRTGVLKGKSAYMSPEQFTSGSIDRRCDVFAVGVMLWQALTGRRLWEERSEAEIFAAIATGQIPSPRSVNPEVPRELDELCMKALSPNRENRMSTAAEFASGIEDYLAAQSLRVGGAQIGAVVAELFEPERATMRELLEQHTAIDTDAPPASQSSPTVLRTDAVSSPPAPDTWLKDNVEVDMPRGAVPIWRRPSIIGVGVGIVLLACASVAWRGSSTKAKDVPAEAEAPSTPQHAPPSAPSAPVSAAAAPVTSQTSRVVAGAAVTPPPSPSPRVVHAASPMVKKAAPPAPTLAPAPPAVAATAAASAASSPPLPPAATAPAPAPKPTKPDLGY